MQVRTRGLRQAILLLIISVCSSYGVDNSKGGAQLLVDIDGDIYDMSQMLADNKSLEEWESRPVARPSQPAEPRKPDTPAGPYTGSRTTQNWYDNTPGKLGGNPKEIADFNGAMMQYRANMQRYNELQQAYSRDLAGFQAWDAEHTRRKKKVDRWNVFALTGDVQQVLAAGLLVRTRDGLIFLKKYPKAEEVVDGELVSTFAVRKGRYTYRSVLGAPTTVPLVIAVRRVDPETNDRPVKQFPMPEEEESGTAASPPRQNEHPQFVGVWVFHDGGYSDNFSLQYDGNVQSSTDPSSTGTWKIEKQELVVRWSNGYVERFQLPAVSGKLSGRNFPPGDARGHPVSLERGGKR
jgi:hypothetical protein